MTDIEKLTGGKKLLRVVESWLRDDRDRQRQRMQEIPSEQSCRAGAKQKTGPEMPSKHLAFFR